MSINSPQYSLPSKKEKQRVRELRKFINHHNYLYYTLDDPEISDSEYDKAFQELLTLENTFPSLKTNNSPTQKVGNNILKKLEEQPHRQRMYSLDNVFSNDEWEGFLKRLANALPEVPFSFWCDPKMDGLALELIYEKGQLTSALTRGDGDIGEVVTEAVRTISNIPKRLKHSINAPELLEIRGEVVISRADFKKLNKEQEKKKKKLFANPRNAASGSVRQLDPTITASRPLRFLAYGIGEIQPSSLKWNTYHELMSYLKEYGFETPPKGKLCISSTEVQSYYTRLQAQRYSLRYEIDGIVMKLDDIQSQEKLGYTSRAPRFAIAWKFPATQVQTRLLQIHIQVGRTGVLTPVAELEPINVGGATISRATLHNEDEIKNKDIRPGDMVIVQRAGDVIPEIVSPILSDRSAKSKPFVFPKICPVCHEKVYRINNEVAWRCINLSCPAIRLQSIIYFVSKSGLNIQGIGQRLIELLVTSGCIKTPADLFTLTTADLLTYKRMGAKLAAKTIQALSLAKQTMSLHRLICALGIRHVGEQTARILASSFIDLDALSSASLEDLQQLSEIGPEVASSIQAFFKNKANIQMINQFREMNIWPIQQVNDTTTKGFFTGKKLLFTGTLERPRAEMKRLAEEAGAIVMTGISHKLDYVIAGKNPGSKLNKAQELHISILDEPTFLQKLLIVL
ncbi:NAD-dependent DNA ligase LigA [Lawsonia intracellularis]|uniref:DNA ligase n=1 Tax=Lawsonia intracellularis (strain PHE/MN1-00) TaxID=363253 RepID=DNLJ_LAWIP|nr:NAD-dependent DNA ligase LigA [Lawsonia intracellularis]Q1MRS8.1 RecName: Full=DNA ligase; AltName: Full=Polydeoxyribonucleotide synthase [NAD(+)] [Lawsonia intracellularis PHE/MN1-00]AGC49651.1 NAD-dependent DNA ligase [Lawsonia intracellularis N343]KAA0205157.1 DNA ligase (NAD(+)) LigA [Lawsonia intracellularis]MBZ3892315.1 NAD-dependent DNA ligase LigA [Lawsonia intracellularis]RBN32296.1 DNA ligase (NAD(+)) LigA [Lawsonia intracellularis]RBN33863.1 DNA ligase (NAD(+)) LigA [Lawsonia in